MLPDDDDAVKFDNKSTTDQKVNNNQHNGDIRLAHGPVVAQLEVRHDEPGNTSTDDEADDHDVAGITSQVHPLGHPLGSSTPNSKSSSPVQEQQASPDFVRDNNLDRSSNIIAEDDSLDQTPTGSMLGADEPHTSTVSTSLNQGRQDKKNSLDLSTDTSFDQTLGASALLNGRVEGIDELVQKQQSIIEAQAQAIATLEKELAELKELVATKIKGSEWEKGLNKLSLERRKDSIEKKHQENSTCLDSPVKKNNTAVLTDLYRTVIREQKQEETLKNTIEQIRAMLKVYIENSVVAGEVSEQSYTQAQIDSEIRDADLSREELDRLVVDAKMKHDYFKMLDATLTLPKRDDEYTDLAVYSRQLTDFFKLFNKPKSQEIASRSRDGKRLALGIAIIFFTGIVPGLFVLMAISYCSKVRKSASPLSVLSSNSQVLCNRVKDAGEKAQVSTGLRFRIAAASR